MEHTKRFKACLKISGPPSCIDFHYNRVFCEDLKFLFETAKYNHHNTYDDINWQWVDFTEHNKELAKNANLINEIINKYPIELDGYFTDKDGCFRCKNGDLVKKFYNRNEFY